MQPPNSPLDFPNPDATISPCAGFRRCALRQAGVAELVDARDSKSRSFGSAGSIPAAGIATGTYERCR